MHLSAQSAASAMWAALTASAAATPLYTRNSNHDALSALSKRGPDEINDVDLWCGLTEELQTIEKAQEALDRTTLGASIGMHIRLVQDGDPARWLEGLEQYVYLDPDMEGEGARGCATIGGDCEPGKDKTCRQAFKDGEEGSDWHKEAWWIFKAVRGAHKKMGLLQKSLTQKTIVTGLKIEEMAEDFETTMEEDSFDSGDMMEWMQVALGLGGSALSFATDANPLYGAASGLVGTAVGLVAGNIDEEEEKSVSLSKVKSSLADMFDKSSEGVDRTLRAAMGLAWDDQQDDYKALPSLAHDKHEESVANFFDTAFWLLDDSAKPVDKLIEAATENLRVHVVDMILQGLGYAVYWDTEVKDKGGCNGNGRIWMNVGGKDRCFLMYIEDEKSFSAVPKDSDLFEKMKKWGIEDVKAYYQSSIDCARSKCDVPQKVGVGQVANEGLPLCYFSAPVKKLVYESDVDGCENNFSGCMRKRRREDFFEDKSRQDCPDVTGIFD